MDLSTAVIGVLSLACVILGVIAVVQLCVISDRNYTIRLQKSKIKRLREQNEEPSVYAVITSRLKPSSN